MQFFCHRNNSNYTAQFFSAILPIFLKTLGFWFITRKTIKFEFLYYFFVILDIWSFDHSVIWSLGKYIPF